MKKAILLTIFFITFFYSSNSFADITVIKIQGTAAYRDGNKWSPLKEKMKLPEGVKVSTGANSYAVISLNSINHTVKVEPLTMIQIFSKETKSETDTHIGLKRGQITANVPRDEKVKTIFKVSTPVATSSVRGTEERITYGNRSGMTVEVLRGSIEATNRLGRGNLISGRQKFVQMSNSANSGNILSSVRSITIVSVNGYGLISEETATSQYSGGDQTGSPDGDTGAFFNNIQRNSTVSVNIVWPW